MSNNRNDTRDYGRNGEIVTAATAGQISSQLQTTGTSTPALVAQALSGIIASKDAFNPVLAVEEYRVLRNRNSLGNESS